MPAHHRVVPLLALIVLAATSCTPGRSSERSILVELRDGELLVDAGSVEIAELGDMFRVSEDSDGFVTFEVSNTGSEPHQFVVVVTELPPDALPMDGDRARLWSHPEEPDIGVLFTESMQFGEHMADSGTVVPGDTLTAIVGPAPRPDTRPLVLLCNLPGHYHRGEHARLEVA